MKYNIAEYVTDSVSKHENIKAVILNNTQYYMLGDIIFSKDKDNVSYTEFYGYQFCTYKDIVLIPLGSVFFGVFVTVYELLIKSAPDTLDLRPHNKD